MSSRPWMPLYIADYQTATDDLTYEQHGLYLTLLMICWQRPDGTLPNDPVWLKRRLRLQKRSYDRLVVPLLARFFEQDAAGNWVQARLQFERNIQQSFAKLQRKKAQTRWAVFKQINDLPDAVAMPARARLQSHSKNLPSSLTDSERAAPQQVASDEVRVGRRANEVTREEFEALMRERNRSRT